MRTLYFGVILAAISLTMTAANAYQTATSFQYPLPNWTTNGNGFWSCQVNCYHLGEDMGASATTPVYAIANGLVKEAQSHGGYGGTVIIEHFTGTEYVVSVTGHMKASTLAVSQGQEVSKGQLIGYVGTNAENGGWSEHCHIGIHKGSYQSTTTCDDGHWIYAGYDYSGCTYNNWYSPADFINSHQVTYSCAVHDQSANQLTLARGQSVQLWVEFTNTGTSTWYNDPQAHPNDYVELKSCNVQGSVCNSLLYDGSLGWLNAQAPATMNESSRSNGQVARFQFTGKVPSNAALGLDSVYFRPNNSANGGTLMQDWGGMRFDVTVVPQNLAGDNFLAFVGNFDGDSKADIGLWDTTTGDWYIALRDPNSNQFIPDPDPWLPNWAAGGGYKLIIADFSGDGYDDICVYHYSTGRWFVAYNDGDHFSSTGSYWLNNWATGNSTSYIPMAGKYNSDAYFDVAVYHPTTGRWSVCYNSGSESFTSQGLWLDGWGTGSYGTYWPFTGKLNTDAYYDVGCYHPGTGRWFGAYRSGSTFSPYGGTWLDGWATGSSTTWKHFIGKSSSDSYDDIIVYKPSEGKWCVAYNGNGSFAQADGDDYQNSWLYGWAVEDGNLNWQAFVKDVSGDGYVDLIVYTPQYGRWFVAYNDDGPPPYFYPADGTDYNDSWLDGWGIDTDGSPKLAGGTEEILPSTFTLSQNYPNPFNPVTIISYSLPKASHVTLTVYNILGQKVNRLIDEDQAAGEHSIPWNADKYSSGIYFYRIEADGITSSKKMLLLK